MKKVIFISLVVLAAVSCQKELKEVVYSNLTDENAFTTAENAQAAVNSIYSSLHLTYREPMFYINDLTTDAGFKNASPFEVLNDIFLPLQSSGLLLTGLAIVLMLALRKKAALMAPLTFGFIGMMVLGLGGMCAGLSVVAVKMKKKALIAVFILCFFCYMGMGYLAAKKDGSAASNWIEQGVNTLGQILLLLGVRTLDKAGLREFRLPG